jgi:hypothetical protein
MASAQLYYEDVTVGDEVRPLYHYMDQMQLVEWGEVSGNSDSGHWHIFGNRFKDTDDPEVSERRGNDPAVTGQFKTALLERMIMEWGGPKTWVRSMDVQYRVWDHFFEVKIFRGTVAGKREENGKHWVDLEIEMLREDERQTTKGTAAVLLPSRAKG